jgi:hypothetical protein
LFGSYSIPCRLKRELSKLKRKVTIAAIFADGFLKVPSYYTESNKNMIKKKLNQKNGMNEK